MNNKLLLGMLVLAPFTVCANDTLSSNNLLNTLKALKASEYTIQRRIDSLENEMKNVSKINPEFGIAEFMKEIRESIEKHQEKVAALEKQAKILEGSVVQDIVAKVTKIDTIAQAVEQGHKQSQEEFHTFAKDIIGRVEKLEQSVEALKIIKNAAPEDILTALQDNMTKLSSRVDEIYKYLSIVDKALEKEGIL